MRQDAKLAPTRNFKMDHRDVVVALTDLNPETQREAVETLERATAEQLDEFALFVARLMSLGASRTIGVWAIGALVARWREQVESQVMAGRTPSSLAWPAIRALRRRCLPVLQELRHTWFGWSEWDDCLVIGPLAAIELDTWYDAGHEIVVKLANRSTPASEEAQRMLATWFSGAESSTVEMSR